MKRCCFIMLVALLLAAPALAVDVPALIAAGPGMDEFPGDDIVVLYQSESIDVDAHLRVTRHVHTVRRLQTQWAMRRHADVRVAWDDQRQELEVLTARTFMTDGQVRETPANGFNEVTPDAVSRAVPFLGLREMVISHIGTEPGCVVELEYVIRDREAPPLPAGGRMWLGGDHPVLQAHAKVDGYASLARTVGAEADGNTAQTANLPAFEDDAEIPHAVWTVEGATESNLRTVSDRAARIGPALQNWLEGVRADPEVLTSGDIMARIATLIHDEIAGVHLPTGDWSRSPRPADSVFVSGVGTAWERALVAMALLRGAGYAPELGVFVHGERPADLPYSHLRVVVQIGGEVWWLAPDRGRAWTGHCDLGGYDGVFLGANGEVRRYQVPVRPFSCQWHVTISPADGGWQAEADLEYEGLDHAVDDARSLAEGLAAQLLEGGTLAEMELRESTSHTLALRLRAEGETLAEAHEGIIWYELPWPDLKQLDHALASLDRHRTRRVSDLVLDTEARVVASVALELPSGWSLDSPVEQGFSQGVGPFTLTHRSTLDHGVLRIDADGAMGPGTISPDQWPEFRQLLLQTDALWAQPVVLITD